jgi:hypothetical protein
VLCCVLCQCHVTAVSCAAVHTYRLDQLPSLLFDMCCAVRLLPVLAVPAPSLPGVWARLLHSATWLCYGLAMPVGFTLLGPGTDTQ